MVSRSFRAILQALTDHEVRFILVGVVSAVLQGAAINTFDVDVVHSTDRENVDRLLAALESLDALTPGHQTLMTKFGALDVLGHIGRGRTYTDLIGHTVEMEIGGGLKISVLDLATLIAVKEEAGGEKDLAVLPILRSVLKARSVE